MEVRASWHGLTTIEFTQLVNLANTMTLVLGCDRDSGKDLEIDPQELAELIVWARKKRDEEVGDMKNKGK
jgi:Holliday junction resolvase